ncbi:contact-dependent growth inhibition system immunity protein [Pseudomonas sp. Q1]|uniref:contact-dependent growth inhibition system immunity protein n=1 Tax=Pseudomonas sp. Q1 TaxID=2202823 RepID=UPI00137537EB|nr:contact-dependent growth inhibition system immunity protein [Pseudomonas sp. Q1]NCE86685.1 hypothetical protein [Pseudomonas sp. Q1]
MNKDYPKLQQFLSGYFNQDWADDYSNADEVIANYLSEAPAETIELTKLELTKLIFANLPEPQLQNLLFLEIGCGYYYPHKWPSGTLWLNHIFRKLDKHSPNITK